MHANEVIRHEENGGRTRGASYRYCIMSEVIRQEVSVGGGRFGFFLDYIPNLKSS